jgi:alanine racemase
MGERRGLFIWYNLHMITDEYKNRKKTYRTWIEVSKSAIRHNVMTFRGLLKPATRLMAVVKSNAYGHELTGFTKAATQAGVDWLGVDSITEANTLRKQGVTKPILVLGYTLPEHFKLAAHHNIAITISTFESLRELKKQNHRIRIHLKIDTGMHRQGFLLNQIPRVVKELASAKHIFMEGAFTHFASAKKPDATHETEKQISQFNEALHVIRLQFPNITAHASATAGTLNYPEAHYDMVRVGIGMYGYWPSPETKNALQPSTSLQPVLTWKTIVSEVKTLEKGSKIGYDYTEVLRQNSKIAILPIGYWHGYFRALSGIGHVLIGGTRCKILGRVSMDMLIVDATKVPNPKVGDEVVLIGKQKNEYISADELATLSGTTCYEFLTRLNPLIKKFYV